MIFFSGKFDCLTCEKFHYDASVSCLSEWNIHTQGSPFYKDGVYFPRTLRKAIFCKSETNNFLPNYKAKFLAPTILGDRFAQNTLGRLSVGDENCYQQVNSGKRLSECIPGGVTKGDGLLISEKTTVSLIRKCHLTNGG